MAKADTVGTEGWFFSWMREDGRRGMPMLWDKFLQRSVLPTIQRSIAQALRDEGEEFARLRLTDIPDALVMTECNGYTAFYLADPDVEIGWEALDERGRPVSSGYLYFSTSPNGGNGNA